MTCHLLIPAAGSGKRMGADRNKLLLPLLDKPILQWTLEAAIASKAIAWIGVMGQPHDYPEFQKIFNCLNTRKPIRLIQGGATRQASVFNGLKALPADSDRVLIHDGARCLATSELFDRCDLSLQTIQGFIAAIPVKDTIKVVDGDQIVDTPNRDHLWAAQTPQGFHVDLLKNAHLTAVELGWEVTDDAALLEKVGLAVQIVMGEETNLKVTTPQDLAIAEFILKQRKF
ncbi:2-C-methyl-D-erythritol 4-phosphate cytidylyltransferase [Pseudanabaena sp. FACHB-1998]|uniref:2-C-methyl-D-erythritol 4-phosphate cytidylyltransferase n=1 Tax=Pseudanabaena sp. FACHB-1998 TaxID=2692858 RepID=UPI0016816811|nr:2-C-methyl-D-erythritol 4-phosphate cytidylyltransferase [Pseudanabaena sp. FACHB-1998]MBD2176185.1 2-C-methyl-D-erythritol 4-phosphate cytidylyltransferase [Pseudanabaena sp. FACHB-1998]